MSIKEEFAVVVPWYREEQRDAFLHAWHAYGRFTYQNQQPSFLIMQQDEDKSGCAATKNAGIRKAINMGAELVVVLDDDCFPDTAMDLEHHALLHRANLDSLHEIELYKEVTDPPSRGTPFEGLTVEMPAAASMGFWTGIGDYDAPRQLAYKGQPMTFDTRPVYGRYFPLCGMNLAFRPADWPMFWKFVDVPRYDDIWMGWMWQKAAYARGYCFSLNGPKVRHARQSNVWQNLKAEAEYGQESEELWKKIALSPHTSYGALYSLLPPHRGGSDR